MTELRTWGLSTAELHTAAEEQVTAHSLQVIGVLKVHLLEDALSGLKGYAELSAGFQLPLSQASLEVWEACLRCRGGGGHYISLIVFRKG